jgi:hypothetical protein
MSAFTGLQVSVSLSEHFSYIRILKSKGKGKGFPVHAMKAYSRSGRTTLLILNFGTRWE